MICALLLAAGSATRYGDDKLLAARVGGRPLIECSATALVQGAPQVLAVVRDLEGPVAERLRSLGVAVVLNPAPTRGLGSSIAVGVAASSHATGWVVALADMPWFTPASVAAVCGALTRGAPLAAPVYRGRRGHPVGFGRSLRAELLALNGARGARALLRRHGQGLVPVPVDDPGILADVDTPADLRGGALDCNQ